MTKVVDEVITPTHKAGFEGWYLRVRTAALLLATLLPWCESLRQPSPQPDKEMPPAPRRSVASKPRYTYGRERSFLDQEEVAPLDEDEDQLRASTLSPLKRLSSPPTIKRVASAFRSMLSGENSQHGSSYGGESNVSGFEDDQCGKISWNVVSLSASLTPLHDIRNKEQS